MEGKKIMLANGKVMIGYATNGKDSNYFWRHVMSNAFISREEVEYELRLVAEYCEGAHKKLFT